MKRFLILLAVVCSIAAVDAQAAKKKAKHVVLIGIDGWAAAAVRQTPASDIPNIRYLMENGSWTLAKRSVMPSASAINWKSLFNGLPTEMHGFDKWNSTKGTIPSTSDNGHGIPPTIFTIIREQHPDAETGIVYDWNGIGAVCDTNAVNYWYYIGTYGKNDIGASSCKNRIQKCVGIDDLHVDLDSRLGSEGIIDHGLKDGTLVTSGNNPYLNGILSFSAFIYISD